jgi:hypothetical protein
MPIFSPTPPVLNTRFGESINQCQAIGERVRIFLFEDFNFWRFYFFYLFRVQCDSHEQCCSKNCLKFKRQCVYQAGIVIPPGSIVEMPIIQSPIPDDPLKTRFGETTNQCQAIGQSVKKTMKHQLWNVLLFYFIFVV